MTQVSKKLGRAWYEYDSDNGKQYSIATTIENGNANHATPIPEGLFPTLPRGWKPRVVYGDAGIYGKTKVPVLSVTNALWVGPQTAFFKDGTLYDVTGARGERRVESQAPAQVPASTD